MKTLKIANRGVAESGTHWVILEKSVSGFILRAIARVTEEQAKAHEKKDEMEVPNAIADKLNWE